MLNRFLLASSLLYLLSALCATASTACLALLIDLAAAGDVAALLRQGILCALLALAAFVSTSLARQKNLDYANLRAGKRSDRLLQSLFGRRTSAFHEKEQSAYLNMLTQDADTARMRYDNMLPLLVKDVGLVAFSAAYIALLSPALLPFLAVGATLSYGSSRLFLGKLEKNKLLLSSRTELFLRRMRESIEGRLDIRACGDAPSYLRKANEAVSSRCQARRRDELFDYLSFFTGGYIGSFFNVALLIAGILLARRGIMSIGGVLAAYQLYSQFGNSVSGTLEDAFTLRASRVIVRKLESEAAVPCEPVSPVTGEAGEASVVFDHVSFGHGEQPLFEDFSYIFAPGGCHAIAGESGSGKSTLLRLILKTVDPAEGCVRIGGEDIAGWTDRQTAARVCSAEQTPVLFDGTLRENICLGRARELDEAAYRRILRDTQLDQVSSRVGRASVAGRLSGGECRRVALARALALGAPILLIDEPTTGLDAENARLISDVIFSMSGVTRIVVTHERDASYLQRFDSVLLMDDVRVKPLCTPCDGEEVTA